MFKNFSKNQKKLYLILIIVSIFIFIFLSYIIFDLNKNKPEIILELIPTENSKQGVFENKILIGSSSAIGGHAGFLGSEYIKGANSYFNEINEKGGVYNRNISLISYDDKYDPELTQKNTNKLIYEDKVFALFNYVGTPTSVSVIQAITNAKIPAVGFFTGAEELRNPVNRNIFTIRSSYYSEVEAAIHYYVDKLRYENIAVLYQDDAFGKTVLKGVEISLKNRYLEPTITQKYTRGSLDIENQLMEIKNSKAQAVILVGTYSPLAKFIKTVHSNNFYPKFHTVSFIGSKAFSNELINNQNISQKYYDDILVTQVVPSPYDNSLELANEYQKLLKKYYPDSNYNYVSFEGFINAKVLVEALKLTKGDITREKLILALESMHEYDIGLDEKINYYNQDHQGMDEVYYSKLDKQTHNLEIFNPFLTP